MSRLEIVAGRIGREGQIVAIADAFAPNYGELRAAAATLRFAPPRRNYPGISAPLPEPLLGPLRAPIATVLADVFDVAGGARILDAAFSLVTAAPSALNLVQRMPHVDAVEPGRFAMVLFLSDCPDGTAFYRHQATGFETLNAARAAHYFSKLERDIRALDSLPEAYPSERTPLFEQVHAVPAKPNRAIFYSSQMLHSGVISNPDTLSEDPLAGRLTVTAFFESLQP